MKIKYVALYIGVYIMSLVLDFVLRGHSNLLKYSLLSLSVGILLFTFKKAEEFFEKKINLLLALIICISIPIIDVFINVYI